MIHSKSPFLSRFLLFLFFIMYHVPPLLYKQLSYNKNLVNYMRYFKFFSTLNSISFLSTTNGSENTAVFSKSSLLYLISD